MTPSHTPFPARQALFRFALIGFGGIGQSIIASFRNERPEGVDFAGVLVRPGRQAETAEIVGKERAVCTLPDLLRLEPDLVVECAGHEALREFGLEILRSGRELITVSSGALCDPMLEKQLCRACREGGCRLLVPAGAILGIDGLAAARHGGLETVTYTSRKPAAAWRGTAAEDCIDLDKIAHASVFFEGDARAAAANYPKNANVTATIALAGVGFEKTRVRLIAEPAANVNIHELVFSGAFGSARLEIAGHPSPSNPRTSLLTGLSVWRAILNQERASIVVGT